MPYEDQHKRDGLLERAKYGEISGDEADAEAMRLGLGRLSQKPDLNEFRPEAEMSWTLPMSVAWIAYRDIEVVREWSAPYRENCWDWLWQKWRVGFDGPVHEGWHLEQRSSPTLALLGISEALDQVDGEPPEMTIREAREALWLALQESFFNASGIDLETGRRVQIPALDWHELKPVEGRGETDEVRRQLMGSGFSHVLVPAAALQRFWRKPVQEALRLPPLMRPDGDGYMPLYCAAQWIATEGGAVSFEPDDPTKWVCAYDKLLAAIASGKIPAVGMSGGVRNKIEGHLFAAIQVDYPFHNANLEVTTSGELYLRSYPYLDEEHWRKGFDDALVRLYAEQWTQLVVEKAAVARLWPFEAPLPPKSGTPGRPTSSHLFLIEMRRRATEEMLEPSLAAESRYLSSWLARHHPDMPQATPKAVQETIRSQYWALRPRK